MTSFRPITTLSCAALFLTPAPAHPQAQQVSAAGGAPPGSPALRMHIHAWAQAASLDTRTWSTYGNGPSHTGYAPTVLGEEPLTPKWHVDDGSTFQQVAVSDGQVYATPRTYFGDAWLRSIDAETGSLNWQYDFTSCFSINPPTVDDGHVYVQRGNHGNDTQLWSFNAETGVPFWISSHAAQWERYLAPTVAGGKVFVNGGYYGGMYGFNQADGQELFFRGLAQYDEWTPTYYAGGLYSFVAGELLEHDQETGATERNLSFGWDWAGWSMARTTAMAMGRAYCIGNPNLYCVDLTSGATEWMISGSFSGTPAVANGVVYANDGSFLKAFDAYDGTYLGVYVGASQLVSQPLITDDTVILGGREETRIYDRESFTLLQELPYGGLLSLADGTLFIASTNDGLRAYDIPGTDPIANLVGRMEPWKTETIFGNEVQSSRTTIANVGDAVVDGYGLNFYLSYDEHLDVSDIPLRSLSMPTLVAGDSISAEIQISSQFSITGRFLLLVLDQDGTVEESNESNVYTATRFR